MIGGGLAGLTVAREVARRGWSVAVLEAQPRRLERVRAATTASCCRASPRSMDRVVSRVGLDHAKALWALSERGLEYVRSTIAETGMPGVDPVGGWLKVSKTDDGER